jgi:hypothetical protein
MDSIRFLQITSLISSMVRKRDAADSTDQTQLRQAQDTVSQENKLAALDYCVLSNSQFSQTGSFAFTWTQNEDGSATLDISYQGSSTGASTPVADEATSNFSLQISIGADGKVQLPDDIAVNDEQIQGTDFTYTKSGVLQLLNDLAARMETTTTSQVDLNGKLDDDALAMLKRLGLIDENGKATQLLQFLSEYAGLDRFKAGQQVSSGTDANYGMPGKALGLQRQLLQSLKLLAAFASANSLESVTSAGSASLSSDSAATATDLSAGAAETATTQQALDGSAALDTAGGDDATAGEQDAVQAAVSASDGQQPGVAAEATSADAAPPTAAAVPMAGSAGAAPAGGTNGTTSSTDEDALELLIETLEATQQQREKQAEAAQRAADQAANVAAHAKLSGKDVANTRQLEQESAEAMQAAVQAEQAAKLARIAVDSAKLQQQQLGGQS